MWIVLEVKMGVDLVDRVSQLSIHGWRNRCIPSKGLIHLGSTSVIGNRIRVDLIDHPR